MSERYSELVIDYIHREGLEAGSRLPAEVDMAEVLGLSRNSVREAYVDLIRRGLIRRKHGVGTFVAAPPILNSLGGSIGFWSMIEHSGRTPSLTEITRGQATPPADIAEIYGLGAGTAIAHLRWRFAADGQPCILIDHYPAPCIPLECFEASARTVVPALGPYLQIEGARLSTQTTAVNADAAVAALLGIPAGRALLSGLVTIAGGDGRIVFVSRSWMVPGILALQQEMALSPLHFTGTSAPSLEG